MDIKFLQQATCNQLKEGLIDWVWVSIYQVVIMEREDTLEAMPLESLPRLGNDDVAKYPLYFHDRSRVRRAIDVPVCNYDCKYSCYIDLSLLRVSNDSVCDNCKSRVSRSKYFIDVGLMQLLQTWRDKIKNNDYIIMEYNHASSDIKWHTKKETLVSRLGQIIADTFADQFATEYSSLLKEYPNAPKIFHYIALKEIVAEAFGGLNQSLQSNVLTWCRGSLSSDESFSGLILNLDSNPNKFIFLDLVNNERKPVAFEYKHTHVHFVPPLSLFVLLVLETVRGNKQISVKVADVNDLMIGDYKLVVRETNKSIPARMWYSSCYMYSTNSIYIQGGLDNSQTTSTDFARLVNMAWNSKNSNFDFKYDVFAKSDTLLVCTLLPCYFLSPADVSIIHVGGAYTQRAIAAESPKFRGRISDFKLLECKRKNLVIGEMKAYGAYSHCIEMPKVMNFQITKLHKRDKVRMQVDRLILVFGGTDDFTLDANRSRETYGRAYFLDPEEPTELYELLVEQRSAMTGQTRKGTLSNYLYPYLNDNSSVLTFEEIRHEVNGQEVKSYRPVVRMLIPRRESKNNTSVSAFLIEVFIEPEMEKTRVVETEIGRP